MGFFMTHYISFGKARLKKIIIITIIINNVNVVLNY